MNDSKHKILLFDADNTLFDFDKAEKIVFAKTFTDAGFACGDDVFARFHRINASLWRQIETGEMTRELLKSERFRRLLVELNLDTSVAAELGDAFVANLGQCNVLIDGALEICEELAMTGKFAMFIVTNGISSVQRGRFYSSPISRFFDGIFISDDIGISKPSKEYFDHVFANTGNRDRGEYLIIGDSLTSDIKGGIDSGIDTCYYNRGATAGGNNINSRITYTISDLGELLGILNTN